jgi:anoctamin-10
MKYDAIIVFPMKAGGESNKKSGFNKLRFVTSMLGLRRMKGNDNVEEEFLDESQRILRTDRCFMSDDGQPNPTLTSLEEKLRNTDTAEDKTKLQKQKIDEMKRVMRNEYVRFTGSDEPCPQEVFCELVLRTIVKRLQMACGLTAKMKYGVKGDQVIVALQADSNDLKTEADRCDYQLQTHNFPFGGEETGRYDK